MLLNWQSHFRWVAVYFFHIYAASRQHFFFFFFWRSCSRWQNRCAAPQWLQKAMSQNCDGNLQMWTRSCVIILNIEHTRITFPMLLMRARIISWVDLYFMYYYYYYLARFPFRSQCVTTVILCCFQLHCAVGWLRSISAGHRTIKHICVSSQRDAPANTIQRVVPVLLVARWSFISISPRLSVAYKGQRHGQKNNGHEIVFPFWCRTDDVASMMNNGTVRTSRPHA